MMDAITELYRRVSSIEVPIEFLYLSLLPLYDGSRSTGDRPVMLQRWEHFQEHAKMDFGYCLFAVIYLGHEAERADRGGCWCRPKLNTLSVGAPYNRSAKCIRVRRDGRKEGRLCFWWERNVGSCPDLSRLEGKPE
ncbi:hypothetical protein B0T20DRAFT_444485 [Sordaria brevicollis]|uniref:Uncharacterized protein n=1 Tax=Sordaria brevicollis TaxID=83679 RepID=A0AAE0U623_SORBR|nr:hypothetical protein B0T20DRAFT_444485 [Sordaria brevicollis]